MAEMEAKMAAHQVAMEEQQAAAAAATAVQRHEAAAAVAAAKDQARWAATAVAVTEEQARQAKVEAVEDAMTRHRSEDDDERAKAKAASKAPCLPIIPRRPHVLVLTRAAPPHPGWEKGTWVFEKRPGMLTEDGVGRLHEAVRADRQVDVRWSGWSTSFVAADSLTENTWLGIGLGDYRAWEHPFIVPTIVNVTGNYRALFPGFYTILN